MVQSNEENSLVELVLNILIKRNSKFVKSKPILVAITGPQGCGKSTLSKSLRSKLKELHIFADYLSLDDYYYPREHLGDKLRGIPGTHDVNLLFEHLNLCKRNISFDTPIYDKLAFNSRGDRTEKVRHIQCPLDILILEGWCVGFQVQKNPPIKLAEINRHLENYQRIWDLFQHWIVLDAPVGYVKDWRVEQESNAFIERNCEQPINIPELEEFINSFKPAYELAGDLKLIEPLTQKFGKESVNTFKLDKQRNVRDLIKL